MPELDPLLKPFVMYNLFSSYIDLAHMKNKILMSYPFIASCRKREMLNSGWKNTLRDFLKDKRH